MSAPQSIRRRLLLTLLPAMLLVWLLVTLLVYRAAQHEVEEVFDADLARGAAILQSLLLHEVEEEKEVVSRIREVVAEIGEQRLATYPRLAAIVREQLEKAGKEKLALTTANDTHGRGRTSGLFFVARYEDGSVMMQDRNAPALPALSAGFSAVAADSVTWRVYSLSDAETGFTVDIGERQSFRTALVRYITRNTLTPLVLALPILALLIWWTVGHALAPLRRVTAEVSTRAADALDALDVSNAPHEARGLVDALNKLFDRVRSAMRRERQFTADAAHELRTPLAAMKAHLQVARAQTAEAETRRSLDQALRGVDRTVHSIEQLLLLARADAEEARVLVNARVDLREVATWAVSMLSQSAFERDIDLGLEAGESAFVRGDTTTLQAMLRNLVDNAVRYTRVGGTVTVSVGGDSGASWVEVSDNGIGVPVAERDKVFDRFHRGPDEQSLGVSGSGLGLSIVRRVADLHRATVTLGDGMDGRGLRVTVRFPAALAGTAGA